MKKLVLILMASLHFISAYAQPSFVLLDTLGTSAYRNIQILSPAYIAALRNHSGDVKIDLRTNTGYDFGTHVTTFNIGDTTSDFDGIEPVGGNLYAYGYSFQPILMTNPMAPVLGPISRITNIVAAGHWNNMLYLMKSEGYSNKIYAYWTVNPLNPVRVDSLSPLGWGNFSIRDNKLYYGQYDTANGYRIHTYTVSSAPPFFTLNSTINIASGTYYDFPLVDIAGNHLFMKTKDSLYDFRIGITGGLTMYNKLAESFGGEYFFATDTNIVCYIGNKTIKAQSPNNLGTSVVDTLPINTFFSFGNSGRLGNNIYYTYAYSYMKLISLSNIATSVGHTKPADDRFSIYPNPTTAAWTIESRTEGSFILYAADGKPVLTEKLPANGKTIVSVSDLPAGNYFYRILAHDGTISSGKLLKSE